MNKEIRLPADEGYTPATALKAGGISALYEEGRLRYVYAGGTEVVRMIYPAVRDEHWTTIAPVLADEKISVQDQSFRISYSATYSSADISFRASYTIEGRADSSIVFTMKGEALGSFKKRRIGLCLLHPVEPCSGRETEVQQPDGVSYNSSFPVWISPFQPFLNIRKMTWITAGNVLVDLQFDGDVFETEDQRNWSDNSYKTYSTPLSLPAPATVNRGDQVQQQITVRANFSKSAPAKNASTAGEVKLPFPHIGYSRGALQKPLTSGELALLKHIPLHHYRVQLDLHDDWQTNWTNAVQEAGKLQTLIELVIVFDQLTDEELGEVLEVLRSSEELLFSILILTAHRETAPKDFFESVYAALKGSLPQVKVGYGVNGNFADLNRNRPTEIPYDFASFQLQPQVHNSDSRTIIDNLGSQEALIRSADRFCDGRPVHISTVRFSGGEPDRRFHSSFAAWWTLLALRNLSAAAAITFYELTGDQGILGDTRPAGIYGVLKAIQEFSPKYILQHTGNRVILENASGGRLVFSSELPDPRGGSTG